MSDYLMRAFRAQLTTSMDSLLRKAVFEIMMMFENSLRDHQMELAQKGEEVAQLKLKLQRAEVKLSEVERGGDRGTETKKDVVNAPEQTADVPEIDFELPDDWCAPLGFDNAAKHEEIVCPSVRLRPLSIPLWPIPIIKEEVVNNDIGSHQQTKSPRRSSRSSSLNKLHTYKDKRSRRPPLRSDTKKLLPDIKQEFTDQTDDTVPRRRGRPLKGKGRRNKIKSKREERKMAATEPRVNETATNGKRYSCKFCKKQFDTLFGRSVHLRSHKKCKGCKKEFPFPSVLKCHKPFCKKLRKMLAKRAQSTNLPKSGSCDEETPPAPSNKQVIVKEHSTRSPGNHVESSIQDGPTKKHSCVQCNKVFHSSGRLKEHMRIHTGERPFLCSMCPKKFRTNQSLKMHFHRMHKDETNSSDTNQSHMWTKPLEEPEDMGDNLMSPKQDKRRGINRNNVQRNCKQDSSIWRTMGTLGSEGFICSLCQKVSKNKYMLIEHFRTHTGEKPLKCKRCPAVFRSRGQLSMHKKKCYDPTNVTQCD